MLTRFYLGILELALDYIGVRGVDDDGTDLTPTSHRQKL